MVPVAIFDPVEVCMQLPEKVITTILSGISLIVKEPGLNVTD